MVFVVLLCCVEGVVVWMFAGYSTILLGTGVQTDALRGFVGGLWFVGSCPVWCLYLFDCFVYLVLGQFIAGFD